MASIANDEADVMTRRELDCLLQIVGTRRVNSIGDMPAERAGSVG